MRDVQTKPIQRPQPFTLPSRHDLISVKWKGCDCASRWRVTRAYWFIVHLDSDGFPVKKAFLGGCELCVTYDGDGWWRWLVKSDGRNVSEGAARTCEDAQEAAERLATWL